MDARAVAAEFAGLGYDPIPLRSGSKIPACKGYGVLPVPLQWADVRDGANVGLRAGDGVAFLDFDDKKVAGSSAAGARYLASIGIYADSYPLIKTPSGGSHVYVSFRGGIPGHVRELARDFAAGEFRFGPAAYVGAPPSEIGGQRYELVGGDYRQLPRLDVGDVLPILQNKDLGETDPAAAILATAPRGEPGRIGRGTWALLRGEGVGRYPSRSEAEAAIMAGLCNAGLPFGAILELFQRNPAAGKFAELYRENPSKALGWLRRVWAAAQTWTTAHASEGRKLAFQAVLTAQARPWPGRTGRTDHAGFEVHALTAYQAGKVEYNLSERELAERAGIGQDTAHKVNRRLAAAGLIVRVKGQHDTNGVLWRLQSLELLSIPYTPGCKGLIGEPYFGHDAFRQRPRKSGTRTIDGLRGGLGKTAAELYALLKEKPMTAAELSERSGRARSTVYENLRRMAKILDPETGELLRLVEPGDGDTWRAVEVDLDAVARAVGTAGTGERQKAKHAAERAGWHERIAAQAGALKG